MDRDASITYAKKYLEDVLSFFGLNTDVAVHCDEDVIELSVPSTYLNGFLIGQRGETLHSLQFLVSMSLKNKEAELNRVNIDVADYKKQRNERLSSQVREWCEQVMRTGEPMNVQPMTAVDRRVVHHAVGEFGQLESYSEGEGRDRHIIISKKADA
jgi:spoIIIJ-associated protein